MKKSAMLEDLARSGLTKRDAQRLKFEELSPDQTKKLIGTKVESYKIPYLSLSGDDTAFFRVRYTGVLPGFRSAAKKPQRYSQPHSTEPHLYLPPLLPWEAIAESPDIPIIFTEGEKKSAVVCKLEIPCIGLGGVWSFRSKTQVPLLDEFKLFNWKNRQVSIIYDSDLLSNVQVQKALNAFAHELSQIGADVSIGYVPESPTGEKQGLDDYIVAGGNPLDIVLEEFDEARALWALNEKCAYIEIPGQFYQFSTKLFFKKTPLIDTVYAPLHHTVTTDDGIKRVPTAPLWVKWASRRTHRRIVYMPGAEEVLENSDYNEWPGWGCAPVQGNISPFVELLDYVFKTDEVLKAWFWQWLAYPLQNPGVKMYSAVLLWSTAQGTGKTIIGYILGKIYGKNFIEINQEHIHRSFNSWAARRQFVLGDELVGSDKRGDGAKLKTLITQDKVLINAKYQPEVEFKDCINYLFTSQFPDGLFIEDKDRRFAIHEITGDPLPREFYRKLDQWKNNGGPAHLFHYLLHEVDCADFDPQDHAPRSASKEDMIRLSKSDLDLFVEELMDDPDQVLLTGQFKINRDLLTAQEIVNLYDPDGVKHTTLIAMSKALRRAGFYQMYPVTTKSGSKRLWPVRDLEKWRNATPTEMIENYDRSVVSIKGKKFLKQEEKAK